ncbi:SDR family oxidoreductase [Pleurocapsales cyanobacterium LEGE 06147]|nr:SDR family oxidoreductase [Pleurocapsales cyanobacterium LEGE 06147]
MPRAIKDSVIVITGASSGIGRATALTLAQQGATLLLAARREAALQEVAAECNRLGGQALAVSTNMTDEEAVKALARRAVDTFGRLDVWVNNAAVTLFARFEEAPSEVFRQVIETNVFGYVHGARAALPYFREQGSGILINVDSVVGMATQPYTSAYVMSKFAIRGMVGSLRMELHLDKASDIHVCMVMPATIDTPLFNQAANYTGRAVKAMNPVYPAQQVADAIAGLVENPQREVIVGQAGYLMVGQSMFAPELYERMMAQQVDNDHLQDKPAAETNGNLFEPMPEYTDISGGWEHTGEMPQGILNMAKEAVHKLGLPTP